MAAGLASSMTCHCQTQNVKMAYMYFLCMLAILPSVFTADVSHTTTEMPACIQAKSCATCLSNYVNFNCTWCEKRSRCSDGLDRHRQAWLESGCSVPENYVDDITRCPGYTIPPPTETPAAIDGLTTVQNTHGRTKQTPSVTSTVDFCKDVKCQHGGKCEDGLCNCLPKYEGSRCQKYVTGHCQNILCENGGTCLEGITDHICECPRGFSGKYCDDLSVHSLSSGKPGLTIGAIICIILITLLVVGLFVWAVYAYRHPTSPSGLFIIEAKHRIKGRGRGSNGVKYKYHQQRENQIDIQL